MKFFCSVHIILAVVTFFASAIPLRTLAQVNAEETPVILPDEIRPSAYERISLFDAELTLVHTDMVVPGNGGLDIQIVRRHSKSEPVGGFALGWKLGFGEYVGATGSFVEPDGTQHRFFKHPTSPGYVSSDHWRLNAGSGNSVEIRSPQGMVYVANVPAAASSSVLKVSRVMDRHGNLFNISYSPAAPMIDATISAPPEMMPTRIDASDGRVVIFLYTSKYFNGAMFNDALSAIIVDGKAMVRYKFAPAPADNYGQPPRVLVSATTGDGAATVAYEYRHGFITADANCAAVSRLINSDGMDLRFGYTDFKATCKHSGFTRTDESAGVSASLWTVQVSRTKDSTPQVVTVTTPQKQIVHESTGRIIGAAWKLGLPIRTLTYSPATTQTDFSWSWGGGVFSPATQLEVISYSWGSRVFSASKLCTELRCDQNANAPLLLERRVSRDGADFVLRNERFDSLGFPSYTRAYASGGAIKTIEREYLSIESINVIGLLQRQSVSITGGQGSVESSTNILRQYTERGQVRAETRDGVTTRFGYYETGDLQYKAPPHDVNGERSHYFYSYKRGVAQREISPEQVVHTREVDHLGRVVAETDGVGARTVYQKDGAGRVTGILHPQPGSSPTTISYTKSPTVVSALKPTVAVPVQRTLVRGAVVEIDTFDGHGRRIEEDRGGIRRQWRHDSWGRVVYESVPTSSINPTAGFDIRYDGLDRITSKIFSGADGNSKQTWVYQISPTGPQTSTITPGGRLQLRTYRAFDDPDRLDLISVQAGLPETSLHIVRNVLGRPVSVSQGGYTRRFGYDSRNYLVSRFDPESGQTVYERNAAGAITSVSVGGGAPTFFQLDTRDRVVGILYPDATKNSTKTWDPNDRQIATSTATNRRQWVYDLNGNLTLVSLQAAGQAMAVNYAYDSSQRQTALLYPQDGWTQLAPDARGLPTAVGAFVQGITYHPNGIVRSFSNANGTLSSSVTDSLSRPISPRVMNSRSERVVDLSVAYDWDGNIVSTTDAANAHNSREYEFDGLERVVAVKQGGTVYPISYDAVGNITRQTFGGDINYAYDAATNRLARITGIRAGTYIYDARGNVVHDGVRSLTFDDSSRLRCIACGTGSAVSFDYDGNGIKVSRTQNGETTLYLYGQNDLLVSELKLPSGQRTDHLYVGALRAVSRTVVGGAVQSLVYHHPDVSGSTLASTDSSGALRWRESYRPYGDAIIKSAVADDAWYHNKSRDPASGYLDFGARNYDAQLGRFLSIDPIDFSESNVASFNRYAYANNNPLKFRDPDGRWAETLLDAVSITLSYRAFQKDKSFVNGAFLGYDLLAAAVPILPGVGAFRHGIDAAGEVAGGAGAAKGAADVGRAGKQARLRELANNDKLGSADRGWIKQELNSIDRGQRSTIRNPPGEDLAHERGREAAKGYDYSHSNLQDRDLHRLQHKYDDFGQANAERPLP